MKTPTRILIALALAPLWGIPNAVAVEDGYVPCRVHENTRPHFPIRLLHQGVLYGATTLVLEISPEGKITDQLITSYTHPDFAAVVLYVLKDWTFEPGTHNGQPIISLVTIEFEFTTNGVITYEKHPTSLRLDDYLDRKYAYFAHGPETLDRKPVLLTKTAPVYPEAWMAQGRRGAITIRFFIDETGKPRLPMAAQGSDDLLAASAMQALKEWRFEPPLANGRPALAYAEQVFVFGSPVADARL